MGSLVDSTDSSSCEEFLPCDQRGLGCEECLPCNQWGSSCEELVSCDNQESRCEELLPRDEQRLSCCEPLPCDEQRSSCEDLPSHQQGLNCEQQLLSWEQQKLSHEELTPYDMQERLSPFSVMSDADSDQMNVICGLCNKTYTNPKVLSCFHSFCESCLLGSQNHPDKIICSICQEETSLPCNKVRSLPTDFAVNNFIKGRNKGLRCTSCKNKPPLAVAKCYNCKHFLCLHCVTAHEMMHCFEGHRVLHFPSDNKSDKSKKFMSAQTTLECPLHEYNPLLYFCRTCDFPICSDCMFASHPSSSHSVELLDRIKLDELHSMHQIVSRGKEKAKEMEQTLKSVGEMTENWKRQYKEAQDEINQTFKFYTTLLEDRRGDLLRELENIFSVQQFSIIDFQRKAQEAIEHIYCTCLYVERLLKHTGLVECLLFRKMVNKRLEALSNLISKERIPIDPKLEFVSNYSAIQVAIKNSFGYIRTGNFGLESDRYEAMSNDLSLFSGLNNFQGVDQRSECDSLAVFKGQSVRNTLMIVPSHVEYSRSTSPASVVTMFENHFDGAPLRPVLNIRSFIVRQKMIYHQKFGDFGVYDGQFAEPSGVAANAHNEIIVADSNNHRIQVFSKEGTFKFRFGRCGIDEGQLLFPNRVAVVKLTGDIVITERTPTHQIQIYNQYGQFVRKFGAQMLKHPRAVTVDSKGRIFVVECKVMRVVIYSLSGALLKKFGCSRHLQFPNGIAVNDVTEEIFISDNRGHCVKVFNYEGAYLRQIGGEGLTNFPIGLGINSAGEILIADNHNNFNLTLFSQSGEFLSAYESKVKHVQCFDMAVMTDDSIALACKDFRIFIYSYKSSTSV